MRTFDEHLEEIEEGIRWGRIKKAMKALNWKYHGTTGKNITRAELKETARRVCEEAFNVPAACRSVANLKNKC